MLAEGGKALCNNSYKQLISLEAGCLVLQLQESTAWKKKKSYFPGREHNFQPKK